MKYAACFFALSIIASSAAGPKAPAPIIRSTERGLVYEVNERGDRLPDFSTCGYASGDREIPNAPVRVVVSPINGDETERIQRALNYVGGLPADTNGLRGAVLLLAGRHEISGALSITNSGVVLRGQGIGARGTLLFAAGLDRRTLIRVHGPGKAKSTSSHTWAIADDYVAVGAVKLTLQSAAGLTAGDSVKVVRPSTQDWIEFIGANEFGGGEGGGWKPGQYDLAWNRTIRSIDGNVVTLNAPITTAIEARFGGGRIETTAALSRITNVGVENLQLVSAHSAGNSKDENHAWFAITMENANDAWVRQVTFRHFAGSAVALYESCQRITVEDCRSLEPVSEDGGYRRNTFFTMGEQTLFLRCYAERGRHDFAVGDSAAGPNAFVQCEATLPTADSGAIESWSSGTLFDNVRIDGNAISLGYRAGNMHSIGWAAANSVLWNCHASIIRCWNPPGAQNWSFGSWAGFEGDGIWRSSNDFMTPQSLYATQLTERTRRRVVLMARDLNGPTNPNIEEAAEISFASRQPEPSLSEFIAAAEKRNPIPSAVGAARNVDDLPPIAVTEPAQHCLVLTNGWLTMDGKLVIGGSSETAWWRGNIRPVEAPDYKPALTRFAPGRSGAGLTDDLVEVANQLTANGKAAFDHNYGLWYDRRRDDHERIRRMNGEVLPPLFEQPFARSGQGTAWDGLSKYDLTQPNPWYWSRLNEFANLCEQRGLILFNQNYFQHNIIEAGAHWVDCPWRTANNINATGFPEPPQFGGDKRIFMAEQFYDVTHAERRKLHEGFIRQNLANFTNRPNVIQFTSAEFTGPLHFVEFWLDTINAWETETKLHPLIALSATKDVQDAILADAQRARIVDVIDFRYWWQTERGLYDPKGGQSLSPRQHDRLWKNVWKRNMGSPTDVDLAQMTASYRQKHPSKAIIANGFGSNGWAFLCAGGSLPQLPRNTDSRLLAAIPRMLPSAKNHERTWTLREANRQLLCYGGTADLSGESGVFHVNNVDLATGMVTSSSETVSAGSVVSLPAKLVWLTRE